MTTGARRTLGATHDVRKVLERRPPNKRVKLSAPSSMEAIGL